MSMHPAGTLRQQSRRGQSHEQSMDPVECFKDIAFGLKEPLTNA
jgi:hypothetical protein